MVGSLVRRAVWAAALLAAGVAPGASAQAITLSGGARLYNEEVASTLVASLRTEFPIGDALILEFASSLADPPTGGERSTGSVFEAQIQLPLDIGQKIEPYVGAGAGIGNTYRFARSEGWERVFSLGAGVRAMFSEQLGVVLDARLRGIGTGMEGEHTDVTVGLRYFLVPRDRPRFRGAP